MPTQILEPWGTDELPIEICLLKGNAAVFPKRANVKEFIELCRSWGGSDTVLQSEAVMHADYGLKQGARGMPCHCLRCGELTARKCWHGMHEKFDTRSISFLLSSSCSDAAKIFLYERLFRVRWRRKPDGRGLLAAA